MDISHTLRAKSDQLNADDLLGGPITAQIVSVSVSADEQPVNIRLSGGHMPWRPCKSMRRVLAAAWGTDASAWQGRWVRLYRDPEVKFAGKKVGGVRISHLSDIGRPSLTLSLNITRGKKANFTVERLEQAQNAGSSTADLDAFLRANGLTTEVVDRWRQKHNKPPLVELGDEQKAVFASWLANNPKYVEAMLAEEPF